MTKRYDVKTIQQQGRGNKKKGCHLGLEHIFQELLFSYLNILIS